MFLAGRCDGNVRVIFPREMLPQTKNGDEREDVLPGDYVAVEVGFMIKRKSFLPRLCPVGMTIL